MSLLDEAQKQFQNPSADEQRKAQRRALKHATLQELDEFIDHPSLNQRRIASALGHALKFIIEGIE